jgi:hypothetical protein
MAADSNIHGVSAHPGYDRCREEHQDSIPVDCFPFFLFSVCGGNALIRIMKIEK